MGGGKGGGTRDVNDYHMTVQYGICHGPLSSINRILVKERDAWCGHTTVDATIPIYRNDFWGGDDKEGGLYGDVEAYMGGPTQLMSQEVASRVGRTPATMTGYRGIANLFFRGLAGTARGFKWTSNNPYMNGVWASVTRVPETLPLATPPIIYHPPGEDIIRFPGLSSWDVPASYDYGGAPVDQDISVLAPSVDLGTATVTFNYTGNMWIPALGNDPASGPVGFRVFFLDESDIEIGNDSFLTGNVGAWDHTQTFAVPVGTRKLRMEATFVPVLVLLAAVTADCSSFMNVNSLGEALCEALGEGTGYPGAPPDMNPAHIILECLTNTDWGRGMSVSLIDIPSFEATAQTLQGENFGLSMLWAEQTEIETFIEEVLDHIQAVLFANPKTGLLTLKLFRDDFDVNTIPSLTASNSKVTKFQRKTWEETTNEMTVTWTNPLNEKEETTAPVHDMANIAIQGSIVPENRNYYGVRSYVLAQRLAYRDIRSASQPLASATVQASREFWDTVPGDVVKMESPQDGVTQLVMRVGNVKRGKRGKMPVTLTLTEEIYGSQFATVAIPARTLWEDTDTEPQPYDTCSIITADRNTMVQLGLEADDETEPRVVNLILARRNAVDNSAFQLVGPTTLPNGDVVTGLRGTYQPTDYAEIDTAWVPEGTTVVPAVFFTNFSGLLGIEVGTFLLLGDETRHEMVLVDSYNDILDEYTLKRGVLDTTPWDWPIGTPVWFLNSNFAAVDSFDMAYGESFNYKKLPQTTRGILSEALAPNIPQTNDERPYRPFRPANVTVEGDAGWTDLLQEPGDDIDITWSNRNRFTEDVIVNHWDDTNVTPETGQESEIVFVDQITGTEIISYTVAEGLTSWTGNPATAVEPFGRFAYVRVYALRDGLRSYQAYERLIEFNFVGYGYDYGQNYGDN